MSKTIKLNDIEKEIIGLAIVEVKNKSDVKKIIKDLECNLIVKNNPKVLVVFETLANLKCETFNLK